MLPLKFLLVPKQLLNVTWRKNSSRVLYGSCSLDLCSRGWTIRYKKSGWLHFKILSVMQQDHSSGGFKVVLLPVVKWADWPLQIWIMDRSLKQPARLKQIFRTCLTGSAIIKFLSQVSFIQKNKLLLVVLYVYETLSQVINKNTNYIYSTNQVLKDEVNCKGRCVKGKCKVIPLQARCGPEGG